MTGDVEKWTKVSNITFKNIIVHNVRTLVETQHSNAGEGVSPVRPIDGFTLSNITGTCQRGITLTNIVNANFSDIKVTGFEGPLLTLKNVTGKGLEQTGPAPAPDAAKPAATAQ